MDLGRLNTLRTHLAIRTIAGATLPWAAGAAAALAALVVADAALALPVWARWSGLGVATALAVTGTVACVRTLMRADFSLAGAARWRSGRAAGSKNALATYFELGESGSTPVYVAHAVSAAAAAEAAAIDPRAEASLRRTAGRAGLATVLGAVVLASPFLGYDLAGRLAPPRTPAAERAGTADGSAATDATGDAADRLVVLVVAPPYSGRPAERLENPSEIAALAGSRIDVQLEPGHPGVTATLAVGAGADVPLDPRADGRLGASFDAREPGSIAVRPRDERGERRVFLVPVRVDEDRAPEVRLVQPVADVLVEAAARPAFLDVAFEATDDFGIGGAKLVWIRAIGEGDATEFARGELPVQITARTPAGAVRGACRLDLAHLGVVPGASLVFHVEARDRNDVTGPSTGLSESLVFEVAAPDPPAPVTLADLRPEDFQRFLVSQRMILERTLKLHARRGRMPERDFQVESTGLARDQRTFKESFDQFIEIHGEAEHAPVVDFSSEKAVAKAQDEALHQAGADDAGKTADPVARAEAAHDAAVEARTEEHQHGGGESGPSGGGPFRDLLVSIRAMWDAERALGIADTGEAIPHERRALEFLKKAQRANRYFSRVKVTTKPVDLKRRYAGDLADIRGRVEKLAAEGLTPAERGMRGELAALVRQLELAATIDPDAPSAVAAGRADEIAVRSSEIARTLLSLETGFDPALVGVAGRLTGVAGEARRLGDALRSGETGRARSAFSAASDELIGAASQLATLLDARAAVRGPAGGRSAGGSRAADYFRRLADVRR